MSPSESKIKMDVRDLIIQGKFDDAALELLYWLLNKHPECKSVLQLYSTIYQKVNGVRPDDPEVVLERLKDLLEEREAECLSYESEGDYPTHRTIAQLYLNDEVSDGMVRARRVLDAIAGLKVED